LELLETERLLHHAVAYDYGEVEDYCIVLDPTISVSEINENNLLVFPNPADDFIDLSI